MSQSRTAKYIGKMTKISYFYKKDYPKQEFDVIIRLRF